jgi:hypothetical protein
VTGDYDVAAARVLNQGELVSLQATADHVDRALAANQRELDALSRIEAAAPEPERLERLCPGRSTTREMLVDAGVSPTSLGLLEDDPELIDRWMAEDGCREVT